MLMSKDQGGVRGKRGLLLFTALFLPVLIGLGFWQLDRAEQKTQRLQQWQAAPEQRFLPAGKFVDGLKLRLSGVFDPQRVFLLDNRTRAGRAGYEVLGVFRPLGDVQPVLVNLGWVVANPDRRILPQVAMPQGHIELSGRLVQRQSVVVLDGDGWELGWPKRIQRIDPGRMGTQQTPLFNGVLRLSEPLLAQVQPGWPVVTMTPDKHRGYALQWFGLALVLSIGSGWYLWKSGAPDEQH